jgi:hypothetical protein
VIFDWVSFEEGLPAILAVPFGTGNDHAEGMTLFVPNGGPAAPAKSTATIVALA